MITVLIVRMGSWRYLPRARRDFYRFQIVPSDSHLNRRSRRRGAESLRRGCVLAAGAPGREPAATDIRADAGLAEIVLRSLPTAVDSDFTAASRRVFVLGRSLSLLDKLSVTLCIICWYEERDRWRTLCCRFCFCHVEASFEQCGRCRAPSTGKHVVPFQCQCAPSNRRTVLNSPRARSDITPGFREVVTGDFQCTTFWTIELELELINLRLDLIFAIQGSAEELAVAI